MASTGRQSASLIEAAAVAGNRYGNAVTARDARVQHVQRAAFTVLLDLAADLDEQRAAQSRKLAKVVRKLGLRKLLVRVPKRVKVPVAALDRLVRKRLATDRANAKRLVAASSQAASVSIYSRRCAPRPHRTRAATP